MRPIRWRPTLRRQLSVLALILALLVAVNVAMRFGPAGMGVVLGPAVVLVLIGIARRVGLSWDALGMSRRTWRKGAAYGGGAIGIVAIVYLAGALIPATSAAFLDVRYNTAIGSALLIALVVIPLGTVLMEEVAFRGVLLGMLKHPFGTLGAVGFSSLLFGLWHVLPSLNLAKQNTAVGETVGTGFGAQVLVIAGVVGFTIIAGVLFCELRRRSGSVLAPVGLHWATNGLGVLVSSLMWTTQAV